MMDNSDFIYIFTQEHVNDMRYISVWKFYFFQIAFTIYLGQLIIFLVLHVAMDQHKFSCLLVILVSESGQHESQGAN